MKSVWRDGERSRVVEVETQGDGRFRVSIDGIAIEVEARALGGGRFRVAGADGPAIAEVTASGERRFVRIGGLDFVLAREREGRRRGAADDHALEAPMPGVVTRVLVVVGEVVVKGQPLVTLEAMKMEHVIRAPRDGTVRSLPIAQGAMVSGGVALVELEA